MSFEAFKLNPLIIQATVEKNYLTPTPIQKEAIPVILQGRDVLGQADTGTGKTAAFAMPILHRLSEEPYNPDVFHHVKALVIAPTRELAIQIGESFQTYGQFLEVNIGVVYGGVTPKRHMKVMKREPEILVATPGRLLDLYEKECVDFDHLETLVIDEADRMLDMGMFKDVQRILALLPKKRQNLLFSATMPTEIAQLVQSLLHNPANITVKSKPLKDRGIKQCVYEVEEPEKTALLIELLKDPAFESVLVFARTKKKADKLCKAINLVNIRAKAIHGDKNQSERSKALYLFKQKEARVLVATDVAARGIDINELSHVINMNIPNVAETYVHRIGRTGRAGQDGTAISFCSGLEGYYLKEIEQLQGKKLTLMKTPLL